MDRRNFLRNSYIAGVGAGLTGVLASCNVEKNVVDTTNSAKAGAGKLKQGLDSAFKGKFNNADLYPVYKDGAYIVKDFSHLLKQELPIAKDTLEHHLGLYKAYVEKVNKSETMMANNEIDEFSVKNLAFSLNGMVLHDIYFHNINQTKSDMSAGLKNKILETFGTMDVYYQNLKDTAMKVEGWSITSLNLLNGKIFNYAEDHHSSNFPAFIVPIMALDVYDHAYTNYESSPAGKAAYINDYIGLIDWDLVSRRYDDVKGLSAV
jgi:Fe-Mn family superoxide dismutase